LTSFKLKTVDAISTKTVVLSYKFGIIRVSLASKKGKNAAYTKVIYFIYDVEPTCAVFRAQEAAFNKTRSRMESKYKVAALPCILCGSQHDVDIKGVI
jgi:hypothetical protein